MGIDRAAPARPVPLGSGVRRLAPGATPRRGGGGDPLAWSGSPPENRRRRMKTHGAVLRGPGDWEVVELELVDPGPGQVLVEMAYAGLCHSDEHLRFESQRYPIVGGHEGAGTVLAVGDGVRGVAPGDHVVTAFLPACGHCRWCASGRSNLCDVGATIGTGQLPDGTWPFRLDGEELG